MPSPADVATGLLSVCGGLIWLGFIAGAVMAIGQAVRHRMIHRRLHVAWGYSAICPMCIGDREHHELPFAVLMSRRLKRKRYKREEFGSGRR